MFEFHVSRIAREKYNFDQSLFRFDGNVVFTNFLGARTFVQKINDQRDLASYPEQAVRAGDINAIGLIDEILHLVASLYRQQIDPNVMSEAVQQLEATFGKGKLRRTLLRFTETFPPLPVYRGDLSPEAYLDSASNGIPHEQVVLEELLMLWITNQNPAVASFLELFDDATLIQATPYRQVIEELKSFFQDKPAFGPDNQDLITMLRSPAVAEPHSLSGQLEYIRQKWGLLLGDYLYRLLNSLDLIREEQKAGGIGAGPSMVPDFKDAVDEENFSPDSDWMPRTVMIAKNTYVWLYQLSKTYDQEITRLDQIPDEELEKLAAWGFNGLWLIGLWERSEASRRIKQLCGNPEAVASAYSLRNYAIAEDLGGDHAYQQLRDRAWRFGIRLASDMVPNHMGIDSDWVLHHPDWFISLPHSPFPGYSFNGPDLSPTGDVGLFIEDHYYDRTDAAVVFKRLDRRSGETRYIYHGNDGTSMPWNDTAQLNYLDKTVREAVIQTILHVARKFPIIRFDAAMTLAKKHYQRLWFPQPGSGGAIPSRAEHSMTKEQFDQAFPQEFWRQVVERVAAEAPETLLLAEAFWMMEGYFVRTLGMHRVYNSAFMNMLRNEENAKYRQLIKNTLEFDPEILKRYVNFMNNPDEKTAVEQFGKGDKYFGICTLMATMPGLPMFGHGQIQGYAEKYGMEYYRPYWEEDSDEALVQRHQQDIFPLLKRRDLFSGVEHFLLYDFYDGRGGVNENVFAYTNGNETQRSLVIFHNRYGDTRGWIKSSAAYLNKAAQRVENRDLLSGLNLSAGPQQYVIFKDTHSGLEFIRDTEEIRDRGLYLELNAYHYHVFVDFRIVKDRDSGQYDELTRYLNGRGVPSIDRALRELALMPLLTPLRELIRAESLQTLYQQRLKTPDDKPDERLLEAHLQRYRRWIQAIAAHQQSDEALAPILREAQNGLEAILKLPVFADRYPFPGSKAYQDMLAYVQERLTDSPSAWYTLLLWNDLRLIGRVITSEPRFAWISRAWLDEWGMMRHIDKTFQTLEMDPEQIRRITSSVKLLIGQQGWTDDLPAAGAGDLMAQWLQIEDIRAFIGVNRYRGTLWFNKEAFETLLWWLMVSSLIESVADPNKSLTESIEALLEAYQLIQEILAAEEDSDYQVENLLEALK